jgi:transposase
MAYRYGDRLQMTLLPPSIEEYVSAEDPVRAYDAFVDSLKLETLGIVWDPHQVGNSSYDPKAMLKLLVYGYSYGTRSSRKLEREVYHNLSFIWLLGGLKPDHKTIAEFRRQNKPALKNVLKQCARLCLRLDLIDGNTLFTDGTKIRANASNKQTLTREHAEKSLKDIDQRIEQLLDQCEAVDQAEAEQGSLTVMKKQLQDQQHLRQEIQEFCRQMDAQNTDRINRTDPESALMHSVQGTHTSFNVQSTVDEKHGLIVHAEVTNARNDWDQLESQIRQATEVLEMSPAVSVADCGYANVTELEKLDGQGIAVIVPSGRQVTREKKAPDPFEKEQFRYDVQTNTYECPAGQTLTLFCHDKVEKRFAYQISDPNTCRRCPHFGVCTKSPRGRRIYRYENEPLVEKYEARYQNPKAQEIYKKRKAKVELPFGHIKRNLKFDGFLMRGKEGAGAETSLAATCFNLARMITLFGVPVLVKTLLRA